MKSAAGNELSDVVIKPHCCELVMRHKKLDWSLSNIANKALNSAFAVGSGQPAGGGGGGGGGESVADAPRLAFA